MEIIYSPQFRRGYKLLPDDIKDKVERREKIFIVNPFDKRLKTHKLGGKLAGLHSFSIDYRYRIIFEFVSKNKVILHAIGDHSLYGKL